jgi:hypothetical protein
MHRSGVNAKCWKLVRPESAYERYLFADRHTGCLVCIDWFGVAPLVGLGQGHLIENCGFLLPREVHNEPLAHLRPSARLFFLSLFLPVISCQVGSP